MLENIDPQNNDSVSIEVPLQLMTSLAISMANDKKSNEVMIEHYRLLF